VWCDGVFLATACEGQEPGGWESGVEVLGGSREVEVLFGVTSNRYGMVNADGGV
jgi:hypothetical protein